jgi:hypothetical protein
VPIPGTTKLHRLEENIGAPRRTHARRSARHRARRLKDREELTQCCSCKITPDGVLSESVKLNLTANPIRGIVNTRGVIKVISSAFEFDANTVPPFNFELPEAGLHVWMTHIQGTKVSLSPGSPVVPVVAGPYFVTETPAADSNLVEFGNEENLLNDLCVYDYLLSGKPCTCQPEDYDF